MKISAHFTVSKYCQMSIIDKARLHNVLTKYSRKIKSDKVTGTAPNSHICKGDYYTMESIY